MDPMMSNAVSSTGNVLSVAHKAALQSSLPLLKKNNKFSKVLLLGKIFGKAGDYLIAIGMEESYLGAKKYFYCQDGVSWAQLPYVTPALKETCEKLPQGLMFSGDISFVYQLPAPPAPEPTGEEAEPEEVEGPKLTEEERLAVVVECIDAETALAPKAALCMSAAGAVVDNPGYSGLDLASAQSLDAFVLLNKAKPVSVLVPPMEKSLDSLMPAESVVPSGALCVRHDESLGCVQVRSLLWPGATAFCCPGSQFWGYAYFGTGEKNGDIAFMLP